jgi:hypothetical protein
VEVIGAVVAAWPRLPALGLRDGRGNPGRIRNYWAADPSRAKKDLLRSPKRYNLARVPLHKRCNMRAPQIERLAPFCQVLRLVVDTGDTGEMTADVVDDRLNDVWLGKATLVDVGDEAPPEIVEAPGSHRLLYACGFASVGDAAIQLSLCFRPTREPAGTPAED